jgi:YbbR domain-containing protein
LQSGFEHISINPAYVYVSLDTSQTKPVSVQMVQHGEVPPGFELQHIKLEHENVIIRGPRSDVKMVSLVQANIDITGIHEEDTKISVSFKVIDNHGDEMTGRVRLDVPGTTANVHVLPIGSVGIAVQRSGTPADGFAFAGITGGPESVDVVGSSEMLEQLDSITVEIDVNGKSSNVKKLINISDWLPEGISLRKGEISETEITARIEPIEERVFNIPRDNVRSRGGIGLYQVVSTSANIRVSISGPRLSLERLDTQEITPEFDLRGLSIGTHTVPLTIELPQRLQGLSVVGTRPTLMVQIHEPVIEGNTNENPPETSEPPEPPDENNDGNEEENVEPNDEDE